MSAIVTLKWFPRQPDDAERWQEAIDDAYGLPAVGTVELSRQGSLWEVKLASAPPGGAYRKGDKRPSSQTDMREVVIAALLKAGLPAKRI